MSDEHIITIRLTVDEYHYAAMHALERRAKKLGGERGDRMQRGPSTIDDEIEGCVAELAYCKYCNVYWSGLSCVRAVDAGEVEVRWTKHYNHGGLVVYPDESNERMYVLMDGVHLTKRIIGWLPGRVAKRAEHLTDFGYLVPRKLVESYRLLGTPA